VCIGVVYVAKCHRKLTAHGPVLQVGRSLTDWADRPLASVHLSIDFLACQPMLFRHPHLAPLLPPLPPSPTSALLFFLGVDRFKVGCGPHPLPLQRASPVSCFGARNRSELKRRARGAQRVAERPNTHTRSGVSALAPSPKKRSCCRAPRQVALTSLRTARSRRRRSRCRIHVVRRGRRR